MKRLFLTLIIVLAVALAAAPALAERNLGIGIRGGWAFPVVGDPASGWDDTVLGAGSSSLYSNFTVGLDVDYRFMSGLTLGLDFSYFNFAMEHAGETLGRLHMVPIMAMVGYQGMVDQGVTGHIKGGVGAVFPSFTRDYLDDYETLTGTDLRYTPYTSVVFGLSGGLDFFVTRNVAFTLEGRALFGTVYGDSKIAGVAGTSQGIDTAFSNLQVMIGIKFWPDW